MFKVSFKRIKDNPSKAIIKADNTTFVCLAGYVRIPKFWAYIPREIVEWTYTQKKVEIHDNLEDKVLEVHALGVSRCKDGDRYDSILGERLAESRAKHKIYEFFYELSSKLYEYYSTLLYGSSKTIVIANSSGGLEGTVKKYEKLMNREAKHEEELLKSKYHE